MDNGMLYTVMCLWIYEYESEYLHRNLTHWLLWNDVWKSFWNKILRKTIVSDKVWSPTAINNESTGSSDKPKIWYGWAFYSVFFYTIIYSELFTIYNRMNGISKLWLENYGGKYCALWRTDYPQIIGTHYYRLTDYKLFFYFN